MAAVVSGVLLVLSFPDFELSPLAWLALVPLLLVVAGYAGRPQGGRAFLLGWIFGTVFFYGSCYWLTYSMIHFGGIAPWVAFILLIPGALLLGVFPAIFTAVLARAVNKWGPSALFAASFLWPALEWLRLEITGQLWNALGYSQAYHGTLIQAASWGGVYAVSFLIVTANAAVALAILIRNAKGLVVSSAALLLLVAVMLGTNMVSRRRTPGVEQRPGITVVAVQPNVPMDLIKSTEDMQKLTLRHFEMTVTALKELEPDGSPRIVIWPESPMNFAYGSDSYLRKLLADLAVRHNASILLNSQEVAPNNGLYNAAVLINQEGGLVAQYDKIRLMPFGEYVPVPQWVPGAGLIRGIVGDFTPGSNYKLMPMGDFRAGVFICIESAYPSIARRLTLEGADVLVNISNDGYLGPTAVMRQHLANTVFRAVENNRPLVRVTNTGITAFMTPTGEVKDATQGFRPEVRIWRIPRSQNAGTFYSRHGDVFAAGCAILSLLIFVFSFWTRKP
ncbi:MAG TPA: apolipoprotein N-acyltransferase [Pyrinomonadaceae bacterium]|nr:apolipoprotein N-acyltransferase [Pyrinomonadaceae bacterium]